jgi:predicted nucleic acid-binding protein
VILVDTSVWVDHLRARDNELVRLLDAMEVLAHPFVVGELALGSLRHRERVLSALRDLPQAKVATDAEVRSFVERQRLFGLGIGWVDAHLLAAVRLTSGARLWTRDLRLHQAAARLEVAAG